ncbi:MAG TPA: hypothetical protein VJS43_09280 [Candidatus Acidoferrales bacterium]|nr:hypothetical protein [Candidatus Acidoferrales bacterium]
MRENLESRLKKATADLLELERALNSDGVDPRVLREFRDAVDYVRKAAWAVQEWQERQEKQRDTSTVLPLLMFERIRRATDLCKRITVELDDPVSEQVDELSEAVDALKWRLSGH